MPSALSIHSDRLLEEDLVAYIVVLPNYQKDEVTLREHLENLVRSSSAERRVLIVLAMEAFEHLNTQDKGERLTEAEGNLSSTWCCWRGRWQIIQHPVGLPTTLPAALLQHMCIVLAREPARV